MRALILAAGASLAIAACNANESANNVTSVDQDLAAQNIDANDTTAIDAATSDDANMAADVNFTVNELDNLADDGDGSDVANNAT
jgi:hypothetical protein